MPPGGRAPGGIVGWYGVTVSRRGHPPGASVASSSCLTSRNAQTTADPASIMKTPTKNACVAPVGKPPM